MRTVDSAAKSRAARSQTGRMRHSTRMAKRMITRGEFQSREKTGVEKRVQRSVAGREVAIRQLMLHQPMRFRKVEGGDVAAHRQVEHEEDADEDGKTGDDEGEVHGAVEGSRRVRWIHVLDAAM